MKMTTSLIVLFLLINKGFSQSRSADSIQLTTLIKSVLKWHQADRGFDFEPIKTNPKDSIFSGINWQSHKKRLKQLEQTNFFSKDFLDTYQKIAEHLDRELKENKTKYYEGDLPPYDHANEWCNCQDYPAGGLSHLKITNLAIEKDIASFKWTWAKNFSYSVKAKKEKGSWRISELEMFNTKNFSW